MSKERQETIADIVADIRAQNLGLPEDSYALSPLVGDLLSLARRIEVANAREREAGAEAAQICGEIGEMIGREATSEKYSQVGNTAKARQMIGGCEVIEKLKKYEAIVASGEIGAGTRNDVAVLLGRSATEIAAKDAEIDKLKFDNMRLKSEQRTSGEVIIEQTNKVEAKDAEIEELKKENARLRVVVSGATVSDGNLREEIGRLREIVKELSDELETMICNEIVKSSKRRVK